MISYPLSQLLELRQSSVRQMEQQLAVELAAVRAAQDRVAAHRAQQLALGAAIAAEQRRQHDRAVNGHVLAHELVQSAAHLVQQRRALERLSHATVLSLAELERCISASRETERRLSRSLRQLAAVQRHQARYLKRVQRQQEDRMEEDAADAWQVMRTTHTRDGDS